MRSRGRMLPSALIDSSPPPLRTDDSYNYSSGAWGLLTSVGAAELPWQKLARECGGDGWAFDFSTGARCGPTEQCEADAYYRRRLVIERAKAG